MGRGLEGSQAEGVPGKGAWVDETGELEGNQAEGVPGKGAWVDETGGLGPG